MPARITGWPQAVKGKAMPLTALLRSACQRRNLVSLLVRPRRSMMPKTLTACSVAAGSSLPPPQVPTQVELRPDFAPVHLVLDPSPARDTLLNVGPMRGDVMITDIAVNDSGASLHCTCDDGRVMRFHAIWLRDNAPDAETRPRKWPAADHHSGYSRRCDDPFRPA